jgi:hypothetical protein
MILVWLVVTVLTGAAALSQAKETPNDSWIGNASLLLLAAIAFYSGSLKTGYVYLGWIGHVIAVYIVFTSCIGIYHMVVPKGRTVPIELYLLNVFSAPSNIVFCAYMVAVYLLQRTV